MENQTGDFNRFRQSSDLKSNCDDYLAANNDTSVGLIDRDEGRTRRVVHTQAREGVTLGAGLDYSILR